MPIAIDDFFLNLQVEIAITCERSDTLPIFRPPGDRRFTDPPPGSQSIASATGEREEYNLILSLLNENMGYLISPPEFVRQLGGTRPGYNGTARYHRWQPQIATILANNSDILEYRQALQARSMLGPSYEEHPGVEDNWRTVVNNHSLRRLYALQEIYQRYLVLNGQPNPRFSALIGENLYSQALIYKELGGEANSHRFRELLGQAEFYFRRLAIAIPADDRLVSRTAANGRSVMAREHDIYYLSVNQLLHDFNPSGSEPTDRRQYLDPIQYQSPTNLASLPPGERSRVIPRMIRNLKGNFAFVNYFMASILTTRAESLSILSNANGQSFTSEEAELAEAQRLWQEAETYLRNTRPSADQSLAFSAGRQAAAGNSIQFAFLGEFLVHYEQPYDDNFTRGLHRLRNVLHWGQENRNRITSGNLPVTRCHPRSPLATNLVHRWLQTTIAQGELTLANTINALSGRIREGFIPPYFDEYILRPYTNIAAPNLNGPEARRSFDEYLVTVFQDQLLAFSFNKLIDIGNRLYDQTGLSSRPRLLSLVQRYSVYLAMAETLIRQAFIARGLGEAEEDSPEVRGRMAAAYRMLNKIVEAGGGSRVTMPALEPHAAAAHPEYDAIISDQAADLPGPDSLTLATAKLWLASLLMSEQLDESSTEANTVVAAAQEQVNSAINLQILRGGTRQRAQMMLEESALWHGEFIVRQGEVYPEISSTDNAEIDNVRKLEERIFNIFNRPSDPYDSSLIVRGLNDLIELYGTRPETHPLIWWLVGKLLGTEIPFPTTPRELAAHLGLEGAINNLRCRLSSNRLILPSSTKAYLRLQAADALSWGWVDQQAQAQQTLNNIRSSFPWIDQRGNPRPTRAISRARALYKILDCELSLRRGENPETLPFENTSLVQLVKHDARDPDLYGRLVSLQVETHSRQRHFAQAASFLAERLNETISGQQALDPANLTPENIRAALTRVTFKLDEAPQEIQLLFKHRPISFARYQLRLLLNLADNLAFDASRTRETTYPAALAVLNHLSGLIAPNDEHSLRRLIGEPFALQLEAQTALRLGDIRRFAGPEQRWAESIRHYNRALNIFRAVHPTASLQAHPTQGWETLLAKAHLGLGDIYNYSHAHRHLDDSDSDASPEAEYRLAIEHAQRLSAGSSDRYLIMTNVRLGQAQRVLQQQRGWDEIWRPLRLAVDQIHNLNTLNIPLPPTVEHSVRDLAAQPTIRERMSILLRGEFVSFRDSNGASESSVRATLSIPFEAITNCLRRLAIELQFRHDVGNGGGISSLSLGAIYRGDNFWLAASGSRGLNESRASSQFFINHNWSVAGGGSQRLTGSLSARETIFAAFNTANPYLHAYSGRFSLFYSPRPLRISGYETPFQIGGYVNAASYPFVYQGHRLRVSSAAAGAALEYRDRVDRNLPPLALSASAGVRVFNDQGGRTNERSETSLTIVDDLPLLGWQFGYELAVRAAVQWPWGEVGANWAIQGGGSWGYILQQFGALATFYLDGNGLQHNSRSTTSEEERERFLYDAGVWTTSH
ncbi:hypothetical protein HZB07_00250 [Candidatus Saganbacteria bacterium]|nr:hypothetical protein [Candidatus Saganbacteria bacterium]